MRFNYYHLSIFMSCGSSQLMTNFEMDIGVCYKSTQQFLLLLIITSTLHSYWLI